ncbi:hypothetical protein D3C76_692200 [compost metagenome]
MGLFSLNRSDVQGKILAHIESIDNLILKADGVHDQNLTIAGLVQARSTALLALTQTLPKEK